MEKNWLLYRGIKSLLCCDSAEVVEGIARYVISQYGALQTGSGFVERHRDTPVATVAAFLGAVVRFLEVRKSNNHSGIVWIARLNNERRAIEPLLSSMPGLDSTELTFNCRPNRAAISTLFRTLLPQRRRIIKLARLLLRRREKFFKVLRVAELLGYYSHYLYIFENNKYSLAVMSSHSNPHGIAFNLAARKCGIPVVLITHGMPVRPIARLSYDLAVVHCETARRRYAEAGSHINRVLIHGRRQNFVPMPMQALSEKLTVGIFLCKDVNEKRLASLIDDLFGNQSVEQIIIRPHPKNLWRGFSDWVESLNNIRVRASAEGSIAEVLKLTDIVLGGNSSVLIEAVTSGTPSAYVTGLDYGSPDLHQLVEHNLIYQFNEQIGLNYNALLQFYLRPEWNKILEKFANIRQEESEVTLQTKISINKLISTQ